MKTKQLMEKYVESGAQTCPYCESQTIGGSTFTAEGLEAWQEVNCTTCGARWHEIYTLSSAEPIEAPNKREAVQA